MLRSIMAWAYPHGSIWGLLGPAWHTLTPPWGMNGEGEAHVAMRYRAPQQQHVPGPH